MITDRSLITFKASVFLQKPTEAKKNWGKKHLFFTTPTLCYCRAPLHSSVQDLTEHWEWKHSDSFQAEQLVWHFLLSQSFYPQTLSCISALTGTLLMFSPPTTALWPSSQLTSIYLPLMWGNNNSQQTGGRARANTLSTAPSFKHTRSACFPTLGLRQPTCSHNFFC